jgi:hypothetical protein
MAVDPSSAFTAGKKIIDYTFQLISASAESREAAKYLKQFERELDNLCKLRRLTWPHLSKDHKLRVQQRICDARDAIKSVAEPNQQNLDDVERFGTVTIYRRVMWTLRDNDAIKLYMPRVYISYASVLQEVGTLQNVARELKLDDSGTIDDDKGPVIPTAPSTRNPGNKKTPENMAWLGEFFARNTNQNAASQTGSGSHEEGLSWLGEEFNRRKSDDQRRRSRSRDPSTETAQ